MVCTSDIWCNDIFDCIEKSSMADNSTYDYIFNKNALLEKDKENSLIKDSIFNDNKNENNSDDNKTENNNDNKTENNNDNKPENNNIKNIYLKIQIKRILYYLILINIIL